MSLAAVIKDALGRSQFSLVTEAGPEKYVGSTIEFNSNYELVSKTMVLDPRDKWQEGLAEMWSYLVVPKHNCFASEEEILSKRDQELLKIDLKELRATINPEVIARNYINPLQELTRIDNPNVYTKGSGYCFQYGRLTFVELLGERSFLFSEVDRLNEGKKSAIIEDNKLREYSMKINSVVTVHLCPNADFAERAKQDHSATRLTPITTDLKYKPKRGFLERLFS